MTTALIILVIIFGSALILGLVMMLRMVRQMRTLVRGMDKRVETLQATVEKQEVQLSALRVQMDKRGSDPLFEALEALGSLPHRGIWPTVITVGSKIFRSYWKNGRAKALPTPTSKEVQS